ncbi:MAG: flavodoxin [Candidatus Neomarinimicrobiota bacterium]|nr:MAG: flavodoxin [Candidatus Neomarinimicrobiota bacterium]
MKTLVVVYSKTGNTLSVAKRIAGKLEADLEVIEDKADRRGILGFLRSGYEALSKKVPPIAEPKHDPGDYELVIIGTPIWAGRMSSPVRAYLLSFHGSFRQVAFFATSAGGGHGKALAEMAEFTAAKPLATVEITSGHVRRGKEVEALQVFLEAVKSQKR